MAIVASTLGSSTSTFWKRRSKAASFSIYFLYSSSVVAPTQCNSPRANAGLSILAASIAPSALPAPTMVCSSSIKTMVWPSSCESSFSTDFRRSSNSPRYFAPASKAAISRLNTFFPLSDSGTSPFTIRCASPSTIAVLPTPGSPINTGLFLVRRCSTWIVRRISSSRPITGSSLPMRARSVKSNVYFLSASRWLSASWLSTAPSPRTSSILASSAALISPFCLSNLPVVPLSSAKASKKSSLAMYASLRFCASLSVIFSRLFRSREIATSPDIWPETSADFGKWLIAVFKAVLSGFSWTPARANSDAVLPSSWFSKASNKCGGSIAVLSAPSAILCASLMACWNFVVSLSKRIFVSIQVILKLKWG